MRWALAFLTTFTFAACGDDGHGAIDAPTGDVTDADLADSPIDGNPLTPPTLAETGLCTNAACTTFTADVRSYVPQYTLYSDGATKNRWIYLPPGTTIDTSDMNYWKFPVGTKLWKEFTRGPTRVETRYMVKLGADDSLNASWYFASYQWNATQDATTLAPSSGVMNANGTQQDIPMTSQCKRCHTNTPGRVLGFQALSLDFAGAAGDLDLDRLISLNLLSNPPAAGASPHFPLPGTAVDKAAFGYMHANCGGCHNPRSSIFATTTLELRMDVTKLATVAEVPAHVTTVNVNGTVGGLTGKIVAPGDTANSVIIIRTTATTSPPKMPEIGTETVDPVGQAALTAWINQPP